MGSGRGCHSNSYAHDLNPKSNPIPTNLTQHVHLFVEVLNHYLLFYEAGCPSITEKYVSALISFINDKRAEGDVSRKWIGLVVVCLACVLCAFRYQIQTTDLLTTSTPTHEQGPLPAEVEAYYKNTLDYIKHKKGQTGAAGELAEKFAAIQV